MFYFVFKVVIAAGFAWISHFWVSESTTMDSTDETIILTFAIPLGLVLIVHILCHIRSCCINPTYSAHPDQYLPRDYETELCKSTERLNQFHIMGTHNSTHVASVFGCMFVKPWRYTHHPIIRQLNAGMPLLHCLVFQVGRYRDSTY